MKIDIHDELKACHNTNFTDIVILFTIHQKYSKNTIFSVLNYYLAYEYYNFGSMCINMLTSTCNFDEVDILKWSMTKTSYISTWVKVSIFSSLKSSKFKSHIM